LNVRRSFLELFSPPVFPDDHEKTRVARLLNTLIKMGLGIISVSLFVGVPFFFSNKPVTFAISFFMFLTCLLSLRVLRAGRLRLAVVLFIINVEIAVVADLWASGGIDSRLGIFYALPIVLAALLLDRVPALTASLAIVAIVTLFGLLGWQGVTIPKLLPAHPLGIWFLDLLIIWILFLATRLSVQGWNEALMEARRELEERRRTEAERDHLREELFRAKKMESLGRMAGSVAHDFNNLLMVLGARLELVQSRTHGMDEPPIGPRGYGEGCPKRADDDPGPLGFLAEPRAPLGAVDLGAWLEESRPILSGLLGGKGRLEVVPCERGIWAMVDRSGMDQILQNLVVNAGEAIGPDGNVTVRLEVSGGQTLGGVPGPHASLLVRDDGRGMDEETKERAFEPFFSTKKKGTGLGLATVFRVSSNTAVRSRSKARWGKALSSRSICL
jgi:signal transduction histidine kinase